MKSLIQQLNEAKKSSNWTTSTMPGEAWVPGVNFLQINMAMQDYYFFDDVEYFWPEEEYPEGNRAINKLKPGEIYDCGDGNNIVIRINK